jgi:hypothetical protein
MRPTLPFATILKLSNGSSRKLPWDGWVKRTTSGASLPFYAATMPGGYHAISQSRAISLYPQGPGRSIRPRKPHESSLVFPDCSQREHNHKWGDSCLQPFATPDPLYAILGDMPAVASQQRRDPAIAIAPILAGQPDDRLRQLVLVFAERRNIALRAARLVHQPARLPFAQSLSLIMLRRRRRRSGLRSNGMVRSDSNGSTLYPSNCGRKTL